MSIISDAVDRFVSWGQPRASATREQVVSSAMTNGFCMDVYPYDDTVRYRLMQVMAELGCEGTTFQNALHVPGSTSTNSYCWRCPRDVTEVLADSDSSAMMLGRIGALAADRQLAVSMFLGTQPQETTVAQQAPRTQQQPATKPAATTKVENAVYQGVYDASGGQQTPTTTPTPPVQQASIIPEGWGWPLAIGGAVIVVGTMVGMWYRNKRGL